jgi:hypothetical protein
MSRDIKLIMTAWGNVRRSVRTGLEYPYKSPSVPYDNKSGIDVRPLLSEDESKIVDEATLKLAKIDPISYSILKSVYVNKQSCRSLARNIHKSNDFIGDKLKMAEIYVFAKIDDVMNDVIL